MFQNLTRRDFIKTLSMAALAMAVPVEVFAANNTNADLVVYGKIFTVEDNRIVEAFAVKDGKFVYVGTAAGAKAFVGKNTKELRYDNGIILPGLVDAHSHGHLGGSRMLLMCTLNDCKTLDKIRERLKEFIDKHPEMERIQGIGWDDATFGLEGPKAAMIDDLTDKPISLIDYGHHSYWLNSAAMKLKNITKDTPDVADGVIVRDAEGNPTGCFREGAKIYFEDLIYHFNVEQYKDAILAYQELFLSLGLTAIYDPMVNLDYGSENVMQAYHQLDAEGKLKLRIHGGYQVFADKNPTADIDTIKILLDGVLESRTAYLSEPYSDKGDGAVTVALDAFEKAESAPENRNAITHMQLVQPTDFDRMAKLGVVAVANPFWFTKELLYHEKLSVPYLGEERAENQYPMKSLFDREIVVTQATDYPVTYQRTCHT